MTRKRMLMAPFHAVELSVCFGILTVHAPLTFWCVRETENLATFQDVFRRY